MKKNQETDKNYLNILTYNIRICTGIDGKTSAKRIADIAANCNPDIIALQEIDVKSRRTDYQNQIKQIAELLNMQYYFFPTIRESIINYGIGILSKNPITIIKTDFLSQLKTKRQREKRAAIWIKTKFKEKEINVINTHLSLSMKERRLQIQDLLSDQWIGQIEDSEKIIFCGDLNFGPNSRTYRLVTKSLFDVQDSLDVKTMKTWPSRYPLRRIDYIFISSNIKLISSEVLKSYNIRKASDHLPLCAKLKV